MVVVEVVVVAAGLRCFIGDPIPLRSPSKSFSGSSAKGFNGLVQTNPGGYHTTGAVVGSAGFPFRSRRMVIVRRGDSTVVVAGVGVGSGVRSVERNTKDGFLNPRFPAGLPPRPLGSPSSLCFVSPPFPFPSLSPAFFVLVPSTGGLLGFRPGVPEERLVVVIVRSVLLRVGEGMDPAVEPNGSTMGKACSGGEGEVEDREEEAWTVGAVVPTATARGDDEGEAPPPPCGDAPPSIDHEKGVGGDNGLAGVSLSWSCFSSVDGRGGAGPGWRWGVVRGGLPAFLEEVASGVGVGVDVCHMDNGVKGRSSVGRDNKEEGTMGPPSFIPSPLVGSDAMAAVVGWSSCFVITSSLVSVESLIPVGRGGQVKWVMGGRLPRGRGESKGDVVKPIPPLCGVALVGPPSLVLLLLRGREGPGAVRAGGGGKAAEERPGPVGGSDNEKEGAEHEEEENEPPRGSVSFPPSVVSVTFPLPLRPPS